MDGPAPNNDYNSVKHCVVAVPAAVVAVAAVFLLYWCVGVSVCRCVAGSLDCWFVSC